MDEATTNQPPASFLSLADPPETAKAKKKPRVQREFEEALHTHQMQLNLLEKLREDRKAARQELAEYAGKYHQQPVRLQFKQTPTTKAYRSRQKECEVADLKIREGNINEFRMRKVVEKLRVKLENKLTAARCETCGQRLSSRGMSERDSDSEDVWLDHTHGERQMSIKNQTAAGKTPKRNGNGTKAEKPKSRAENEVVLEEGSTHSVMVGSGDLVEAVVMKGKLCCPTCQRRMPKPKKEVSPERKEKLAAQADKKLSQLRKNLAKLVQSGITLDPVMQAAFDALKPKSAEETEESDAD